MAVRQKSQPHIILNTKNPLTFPKWISKSSVWMPNT